MNDNIRTTVNDIVAVHIAAILDEMYSELYTDLADGKMNLKFHDVFSVVETHLEQAADNINSDLKREK